MDRLSHVEARVLGALVEKALSVPQYYPLTLNALVAACNQTSNREPLTTLAEGEVLAALDVLRERRLVRTVLPSLGRSAARYRHVLDETLGLDAPQLAVLAVLVLRGPQTPGELRSRTERMAQIGPLDHELELLSSRTPPLVMRVGRRPGQKEDRWAVTFAEPEAAAPGAGPDVAGESSALEAVRAELVELRAAVDELRGAVAFLRDSLGG